MGRSICAAAPYLQGKHTAVARRAASRSAPIRERSFMRLRKFIGWLRDERAVTSTEYAVLLALLLGVMTSSINCLGRVSQRTFERAGQSMSTPAKSSP